MIMALFFRPFVPCHLIIWIGLVTYCHRVLHVSHSGGELAEVQFGAVDQRVSKISTAAASTHTCNLPLLTVGHHSCMVLSCGDSLDSSNKTIGFRYNNDIHEGHVSIDLSLCCHFSLRSCNTPRRCSAVIHAAGGYSLRDAVTYLCPCQRGHVQNYISWQIFTGIHNSISQNQSALSISVVDLHGPSE